MATETGTSKGSRTCNCNKKNTKLVTPEDAECPWWINSKAHNFCFWTYVRMTVSPDGSIEEHRQSEIAHLLGVSDTKAHFLIKEAMAELIEAFDDFGARDLIGSFSGELDEVVSVGSISEPAE